MKQTLCEIKNLISETVREYMYEKLNHVGGINKYLTMKIILFPFLYLIFIQFTVIMFPYLFI